MIRSLKNVKFPQEVIQCAHNFKCDICSGDALKKVAHPATLDEASFFNDVVPRNVAALFMRPTIMLLSDFF